MSATMKPQYVMNIKITKHLLLLATLLVCILLVSCETDEKSIVTESVTGNDKGFYIRGILNDEKVNIGRNDSLPIKQDTYTIDNNGSQTLEINVPEKDSASFCYGRYVSSIKSIFRYEEQPEATTNTEEDTENIPVFKEKPITAKIYFSKIPIDECIFSKELEGMNDFFDMGTYQYERFNDSLSNVVIVDYFPEIVTANKGSYYSSRFGDNADSVFEIKNVTFMPDHNFIVEGILSCKLYNSKDSTLSKELKDGSFRIWVRSNYR